MDAVLKAEFDKTTAELLQTYDAILSYGCDELKNPQEILKMMEDLLQIKQDYTFRDNVINVAKEESTVEEYRNVYERECEKGANKAKNIKRSNEYKEFKNRLENITTKYAENTEMPNTSRHNSQLADEIEIMETEINIYDPLTKLAMNEPVRNTICGHHYDKETIIAAIKGNRYLRCPVAGCGNKNPIQESHLVGDHNMKLKIQRILSMEE